MCGIVGYVGEDYNNREWVEAGIEKLHHRGPDGKGILSGNKYIFGHTRLSIIDLSSAGSQPMKCGDWIITFNGEIYNYQQLATYLTPNDDLGRNLTDGDTSTFLKYIAKYGIWSALNASNGMWSFGAYNTKTEMFYASVDRFAQKPFYYYQVANQLWFGSSPNLLYNLKERWELDNIALQSYWHLGGIIGPNRLLKGIKKLCANELLSFNTKTGQLTIENYWQPSKAANPLDIALYVQQAIDSVKVSHVPVNIFLSGGIDSSLVASRFKGANAIHLRSNEEQYAAQVSDKFGLNLKIVDPTEFDIIDILQDYVMKSGEPTMAGAIPWITAKYASQFGKVAVIANGADELFFGYDRIQHDNDNDGYVQNMHMLRGSGFYPSVLNRYRQKYNGRPSSRWTELMNFVQFDINSTLDFASMCHSLEVRSPFLDHRLVEAAMAINEPDHRKQGNKTLLKEMLWNLGFDKKFTDRPKQGFSLHFKPEGIDDFRKLAFSWVVNKDYLKVKGKLTPRDLSYLEAAAMGFKVWHYNYAYLYED